MTDNSREIDTNQFNTFDAGSEFQSYENKEAYLAALSGARNQPDRRHRSEIENEESDARNSVGFLSEASFMQSENQKFDQGKKSRAYSLAASKENIFLSWHDVSFIVRNIQGKQKPKETLV